MTKITNLLKICHKYYQICKIAAWEKATLHRDKYGYFVSVAGYRAYIQDGQLVLRAGDQALEISAVAAELGMPEKKLIELIKRDIMHAIEWAKDKEIELEL